MGNLMLNNISYTGGGSGGSTVIPNPPEVATDVLTSVNINGTVYGIGSGGGTVSVDYDTPFDTGKRMNDKIIYGYYDISSPVSRANWNDCMRELVGLPDDITLIKWDIKYIANVYWQKGESNDSLYISKSNSHWYVTCYYTYNWSSATVYTYIEFVEN